MINADSIGWTLKLAMIAKGLIDIIICFDSKVIEKSRTHSERALGIILFFD